MKEPSQDRIEYARYVNDQIGTQHDIDNDQKGEQCWEDRVKPEQQSTACPLKNFFWKDQHNQKKKNRENGKKITFQEKSFGKNIQ